MDAKEISARFGLGAGAKLSDGPVANGRQGAIWRLETSTGRWAVKTLFHPADEDEAHAATVFHEAAYAAGVPTPQVRRTVAGTVFALIGQTPVRVYEWVDLKGTDTGLDPELVGTVVAAVHRVPAAGAGPVDPWYREPLGPERWDELVRELAAAGAPFAGRLAGLRDELVALESWLEPADAVQTCHRDLWAANLLGTADGGVCVIDWENSGPADPSHELACVVFEFGRTDPGRARALVDAYRQAGGPGTLDRRGHFSMLIAQLGHITEIAATDWLHPEARNRHRADSAAWISEVLDEPHTRELLAGLLAAVGSGKSTGVWF
ncbi:phosphotransferase enzyme family protein [Catellatospora coxensis]|uniref:Aminoglycoside phosphotransferase domain-containing protein n=1 Tax=Catellatospora coxensis TaxID=310354 RepID=A0A8J3P9Q0_9ACTN|nr:phosphotransferase [Catellatospora coxensis]GIG09047.1 hypothetical protein Cco03nite_57470 [Catellatospora coxensis]